MGDEKKTITLWLNDECFSGEVTRNGDSEWSGRINNLDGKFVDLEKGVLDDRRELKSGTVRFSNGNVYEGKFSYERPEDLMGKLTYANGDIYEGKFSNGEPQGKGTLTYKNGNVYEGEFSNGKRHGHGKLIYADGDVYEGEFSGGIPYGRGKFIYSDGRVCAGEFTYREEQNPTADISSYDGLFYDGKRQGWGKLTYKNGDVYEGEFSGGQPHGHGKFTSAGGTGFKGEFSEGKALRGFSKNPKNGLNYYETRDSLERLTSHQLFSGEPERDEYKKVKTDLASTAKLKPLFRETRNYGDSDSPESENVEYFSYGEDGSLKKRLEVNYDKINRLLSSGDAKNLEDLVAGGALVVWNGAGAQLKLPTNDIKKLLLDSAKGIADLRSAKGAEGFGGGVPSEAKVTILSMVRDENLGNVRFSTEKISYSSMTSFLESMGIDEENLKKTEAKYISLDADTDSRDHAVCLTVDLERIRKDVRAYGWGHLDTYSASSEPYILAFDSSRVVGRSSYKGNFGNITGNLKFMNKRQQKGDCCWFHSETSVLTTVENPRVMEKMFSGETETYELDGRRNIGNPNEIMVLQMQKLQSVADALGVNLGEGEFLVAGIVQERLIERVAELAKERALLEDLDKRIEKTFEKFEEKLKDKNAGVKDKEYKDYKEKITEEHKKKLREEIKNIPSEEKAGKSPEFVENLKKLEEVNRQINNLENRLKAGLEKFGEGTNNVKIVDILEMNDREKEEKEKKEKEEREKKEKEEREKDKEKDKEKEEKKKREKEEKEKEKKEKKEKEKEKEKKEKKEKKGKEEKDKGEEVPEEKKLEEEEENIVSTSTVLKTLRQSCTTVPESNISGPNTIVSGVSKKGQGQGVV